MVKAVEEPEEVVERNWEELRGAVALRRVQLFGSKRNRGGLGRLSGVQRDAAMRQYLENRHLLEEDNPG